MTSPSSRSMPYISRRVGPGGEGQRRGVRVVVVRGGGGRELREGSVRAEDWEGWEECEG